MTHLFYKSEIVFKIKKRNARCLHFPVFLDKLYNVNVLKIYSCLTNVESANCACKPIGLLKLFKDYTLMVS